MSNQLTPIFPYLIRGDTITIPIKATQAISVPDWASLTIIEKDKYIQGTIDKLYYFQCEVAGKTGEVEPDWASANQTGDTIIDGDVTWKNRGLLVPTEKANIAEQPVSLADCVFSFTAKTSPGDSDDAAQVRFDYDIPDNENTKNGEVTILIPKSKMQELIPGNVYVDIQIEFPATPESIVKSFSVGKLKVHADMTQRVTDKWI